MDLPELRHLVGRYLEPKDALSCLKVSRAWHESFSESAFRKVSIRSRPKHPTKDRVPSRGWLLKYGRFIETLDFISNTPLLHLIAMTDVQERHQTGGRWVLVLFPRMTVLNFAAQCSLRELEQWLLHCPGLETVYFEMIKGLPKTDADGGEAILVEDDKAIQLLQHCPRLTRLDLNNGRFSNLENNDLARIINHWPPLLTKFRLVDCSDHGSPQSWFEALLGNLQRMTVLNLYECVGLKSWMFTRIVSSCPLLVELYWRHFIVQELFGASTTTTAAMTTRPSAAEEGARIGPWACTGLKRFVICMVHWSKNRTQNDAAMDQLGFLQDMRWLFVDIMHYEIIHSREEQSRFLRDYPWPKKSCNYSAKDLQTIPEVQWMHKTWPLLEHFQLIRWMLFHGRE